MSSSSKREIPHTNDPVLLLRRVRTSCVAERQCTFYCHAISGATFYLQQFGVPIAILHSHFNHVLWAWLGSSGSNLIYYLLQGVCLLYGQFCCETAYPVGLERDDQLVYLAVDIKLS